MNEDVNDPVVSQRYRELAAEKAPDALNQAVLREARQHTGSRYSRTVFWLRPMAWAASVGLCLAIVVELNELPRPEPSMMPLPASVPAPAPEQSPMSDEEAPARAMNLPAESDTIAKDAEQIDPVARRANDAEPEPGMLSESMEQRARKTVDADGRVSLEDLAQLEKSEFTDNFNAERSDDFTALDAPALEELEALTRMREGDNVGEISVEDPSEAKQTAIRSFAASAAPGFEMAATPACDPAQRETPELWLECIQGLETDGMAELAAFEREQLLEAYPDFEFP